MRHRDGGDFVSIALEHIAGRELDQLQLKAHPSGGAQRQRHELLETRWAVDRKWALARTEIERLQQPGQPEPMIGVEVGEEYLGEIRESHRPDQLSLGPLTAVEQDPVAAAADEHRGQPAPLRRDRAGGAGEEHR